MPWSRRASRQEASALSLAFSSLGCKIMLSMCFSFYSLLDAAVTKCSSRTQIYSPQTKLTNLPKGLRLFLISIYHRQLSGEVEVGKKIEIVCSPEAGIKETSDYNANTCKTSPVAVTSTLNFLLYSLTKQQT